MDKADGAGMHLFDLKQRDWSLEVLDALEIPRSWMPKTYEGPQVTGAVTARAARPHRSPPPACTTGVKSGVPSGESIWRPPQRTSVQAVGATAAPGAISGSDSPAGGGRVAEEQSVTVLSDGSLFCVYRTIDGWPAWADSRDGGHTGTPPADHTYSPGGRRVKHPRAANFVWRCANGRFLYWFHNHGGHFVPLHDPTGYEDRNPVWFSGGIEVDTPEGQVIRWSQPEIGLYDDDPYVRMSYPDLVREGHRFFLTETQKDKARVHEIPRALLEAMWNQFEAAAVAREGLLLELPVAGAAPVDAPDLIGQAFHAENMNEKWCGDITYIKTWKGWAFLAVVIDLHSRKVVGWAVADHMRTELVIEALSMALTHRKPASGVIYHSDRGCQFTSAEFAKFCKDNGVRRSFGRTGVCYDNAVSESLFATVKKELIHTRPWVDLSTLRKALFSWIEEYYNRQRRHSTLGYLTPHEFESGHRTLEEVAA